MQSKFAYQWKEKRRARLSFLGAEIVWSILFSIADNLFSQGYLKFYPEDADLVLASAFYYQFSFTLYGLIDTILLILQIYVFALILTQRVRDIGIKYPIIIGLICTVMPILLAPYILFTSPNIIMSFFAVLLIIGLVAFIAPSARNVTLNINEDKKGNNDKFVS